MTPAPFWQARPVWWAAIIAVASYGYILSYRDLLLVDPDTYWHIATGQWILDHWAIPSRDPFSHSMRGADWVPHGWLGEVILALSYKGGGWSAVTILGSLSFAATLALAVHQLLKSLKPVHALIFIVLAEFMLLPHVLARPHLLAAPLQVIWMASLVNARQADRRPSFAVLPIMALWANLHGGFIFGLIFTLLFGAEALYVSPSWRAALRGPLREWGLFAFLALIAALATPNGIAGLLFPFHVTSMKNIMAALTEWRSPNFQQIQPVEIWLMLTLFGAFCLGLRLPLSRLLMVLLLLHLALTHQRNTELLGIFVPLITSHALAPQLAAMHQGTDRSRLDWMSAKLDGIFAKLAGPISMPGMAAALLLMAVMTAWFGSTPIVRRDDTITPISALKAVAAYSPTGPVFNSYGFGGYLVFSGIQTFIDGRAGDLYDDEFFKNYALAIEGKGDHLQKLLEEYHIGWTLLGPDTAAVAILDLLPGWKRVYSDEYAVVHVRAGQTESRI